MCIEYKWKCTTCKCTIVLTCGIPKESRRVTPIWDGVRPFLASLQMWSVTSSGFIFSHVGARRLYGSAELLIPLPGPYMRPILSSSFSLN